MIDKTNTCACCGQAIRPPDRLTVQVDDDLLRLCNEAYEEADRRGARRIEVAHVVLCIASGASAGRWFERLGVSRSEVTVEAERALGRIARRDTGCALQASDDLKAMLVRAEDAARRSGRAFASPLDFLAVAFARPDEAVSPAPRAAQHVPERARPRTDASEHTWDAGGVQASRVAALVERIEQQDHDIGELRMLLARLMKRRDEAAEDDDLDFDDEPDPFAAADDDRYARDTTADFDMASSTAAEAKSARPVSTRSVSNRSISDPSISGRAAHRLAWRQRLRARSVGTSRRCRTGRRNADIDEPSPAMTQQPASRLPSRRANGEGEPRQFRFVHAPSHDLAAASAPIADNDIDDEPGSTADRMKRFYLSPDDDILRAPSIGPKTAGRLKPAGIVLVRDLLACDPAEIVQRTAVRYITADRVTDWKAQARLVCTIPWLRGTHAQLLVGAGYDSLAKLVRADAAAVCAAVLRYAATREGQSILRSGPPPEIDRIACWIENTALAEPNRAA